MHKLVAHPVRARGDVLTKMVAGACDVKIRDVRFVADHFVPGAAASAEVSNVQNVSCHHCEIPLQCNIVRFNELEVGAQRVEDDIARELKVVAAVNQNTLAVNILNQAVFQV